MAVERKAALAVAVPEVERPAAVQRVGTREDQTEAVPPAVVRAVEAPQVAVVLVVELPADRKAAVDRKAEAEHKAEAVEPPVDRRADIRLAAVREAEHRVAAVQ